MIFQHSLQESRIAINNVQNSRLIRSNSLLPTVLDLNISPAYTLEITYQYQYIFHLQNEKQ
jgi:hypothetical protein